MSCLTAEFNSALCSMVRVIEPEINVVRQVPEQVVVCEDVNVIYRISNTGTGTARNLVFTETLPEGQTFGDGSRNVRFEVDKLAEGETRAFSVKTKVAQAGTYSGSVSSEDGVQSESTTVTAVAPQLELNVSAPDTAFTGRDLNYTITVRNTGEAVARDLVVTQNLPQGARLVNASNNGQPAGDGSLVWRPNALEPGGSVTLTSTLRPSGAGTVDTTVTANAYCADRVQQSPSSTVENVAAILLELVDTNDPVPVGQNEVYEIRITNQGSKQDSNVVLTMTLPEGLNFVSGGGDATANAQDKTVTFNVGNLAAKQRVTLTVEAGGCVRRSQRGPGPA